MTHVVADAGSSWDGDSAGDRRPRHSGWTDGPWRTLLTSDDIRHVSDKGVDLTGLLGDIKEGWGLRDGSPPEGSRGGATVGV